MRAVSTPRAAPGAITKHARARGRGARDRARARALEPNREWPPSDVWEDFCAAHEGGWHGAMSTHDPRTGRAIAPDGDASDGDAVRDGNDAREWTISTVGGMTGDGDALRLETRGTRDGASSDGSSDERAVTDVCGGGQMGKMFIVQGCYAHGPKVLPACEEGAEAEFEFAFAEEETPGERRRVRLVVRAAPGKKRNWELVTIELTHEMASASGMSTCGSATGEFLTERALGSGEWRASSGVTFIAIEALAEVPEDREEIDPETGEVMTKGGELGPAQKLAREKPDDTALARAAAAEKAAEENRAKEELDAALRDPEGMLVVPWWAVKSPSSWSMAGEYIIGGNSPLVFLPNNMWVLVESVDNQLVVECGRYDEGVPSAVIDDTERRVLARRYRKGRFASAFFVRECRLDPQEREDEADEFDIFDEDFGFDQVLVDDV